MSERPLGVTIIGILWILFGLLMFVLTFIGVLNGGMKVDGSLVLIIVGIITLILGVGCFKAWSWVWIVGIVITALLILKDLVDLFNKSASFDLLGLIIFAIILYYLFQPQVKAYFGKT